VYISISKPLVIVTPCVFSDYQQQKHNSIMQKMTCNDVTVFRVSVNQSVTDLLGLSCVTVYANSDVIYDVIGEA